MLTQSAPSTFGDLLRQHRRTAGLTQHELAERAGLSVHGIQKLERGATRPYRDTARRLIVALQLEADDRSRFQAAVTPVHQHSSVPQVDRSGEMRHNLPSPTTSLVGREGAAHEIRRRLAETRLLTLTGVGGCGKARLALEVARTVVEHYTDGGWLVELGPLGVMPAERLAGHTLADCLDWLATATDSDGRPHEEEVLFGAAEAQWRATGAVRYAPERAAYAAELARVQEQLAAAEFAAAWAEGHAMSREPAINYALEVCRG